MGLQEAFTAMSETWKAILVLIGALTLGISIGIFTADQNNLPEAVNSLAESVGDLQTEVSRLNRSQQEAENDRRELRCIALAVYRGSGLEACLAN